MTQGDTSRQAIMEAAGLWQARMDSGTADAEAFEAWRAADPRHAAAFARLGGVLRRVDQAKKAGAFKTYAQAPRLDRRGMLAAGGGLAASLVLGAVFLPSLARARVHTPIGGTRRVMPGNGLSFDVNTDSQVSWVVDDKHSEIWLERGEMALKVQKGHPCRLSVGGMRLTLIRGDFNLRLHGKALDLMALDDDCVLMSEHTPVIDGAHRIAQAQPVGLKLGQAGMATDAGLRLRTVSDGDIEFTSGWRRGELVLDGQSLGSVVDEYNRYLHDQIVIADPQLASVRLGGRFDNRNPDDFLAALKTGFDVRVERDDRGTIILTK